MRGVILATCDYCGVKSADIRFESLRRQFCGRCANGPMRAYVRRAIKREIADFRRPVSAPEGYTRREAGR